MCGCNSKEFMGVPMDSADAKDISTQRESDTYGMFSTDSDNWAGRTDLNA